MGFKDWMLLYAEGDVRPVLQAAPAIDRDATRALVSRLYAGHDIVEIADGTLFEQANPPEGQVYAGCFAGLTVLCTYDAALDQPSQLDPRFVAEAAGRTLYSHAMHSVVDFFAYAIWSGDGQLRRALSLWPESGILDNIGTPLPFEEPYWAGEHALEDEYPLPFHPLDLAEDVLRALFGFNYEGAYHDDDPDLMNIVLAGFAVSSR